MASKTEERDDSAPDCGKYPFSLEELERQYVLGRGATSTVWRVQDPAGNTFALKEMKRSALQSASAVQHAVAQRDVLQAVCSPFVQRLEATFKDADAIYYLLQEVEGSTLLDIMRRDSDTGIAPHVARLIAAHVACAIGALHSVGAVYRDLKATNVMLDSRSGVAVLIDCGLAKLLPEHGRGRTHSVCGTWHAMAPEQLTVPSGGYGLAVDWWALGVLTYEMMAGQPPWGYSKATDTAAQELARRGADMDVEFPAWMLDGEPEAVAFIGACLTVDESSRISSLDAVREHPWMRGLAWAEIESGNVPIDLFAEPEADAAETVEDDPFADF